MNEPQFEGELVIGRFYSVPTVYGPLGGQVGRWPVLGPLHDDRDVIGFEWEHYHYDWRFFSPTAWDYVIRWATNSSGEFKPHGLVMSDRPDIPCPIRVGPVIYRRRKCYRLMPEFPREFAAKGWLKRLEAAYANQTLKPGLICPHRGASLRGLPVVDGCITCPLHGLRWDVATGRLVAEGS